MCLKRSSPKQQRGFLMPMAIFILVVMGFMALSLSRTTGQAGIATVQEAVSLQALYAAESGAQSAMAQLLYDTSNALTRAAVDGRCGTFSQIDFSATGLNNCSVNASCTYTTDAATSFYRIISTASCGSGGVTATRSLQLASFFSDN